MRCDPDACKSPGMWSRGYPDRQRGVPESGTPRLRTELMPERDADLAADGDRAGPDLRVVGGIHEPDFITPRGALIRLPPTHAGAKLHCGSTATAEVGENQTGAAGEVHAVAMAARTVGKQHVHTGIQLIGRVATHRIDEYGRMALPHHVAGRGHEAEPHIDRRLNHEAARNVLRF